MKKKPDLARAAGDINVSANNPIILDMYHPSIRDLLPFWSMRFRYGDILFTQSISQQVPSRNSLACALAFRNYYTGFCSLGSHHELNAAFILEFLHSALFLFRQSFCIACWEIPIIGVGCALSAQVAIKGSFERR